MVIKAFRLGWRLWWTAVPHGFRSSGQFSSAICRRCGQQMIGWHV